MPADPMYPVRISKEQRKEMAATAKFTGLPHAETVRQAIKHGLPVVRKLFGKKR